MSVDAKDKMSWLRAAGIGLVAGVLLVLVMGLVIGIIGAVVVAYALRMLMGGTPDAPAQLDAPQPAPPAATPQTPAPEPVAVDAAPPGEAEPVAMDAAPQPGATQTAPAPASGEPAAQMVKPSSPLAGEADLAARKGTWRYGPSADGA